MYVFNLWRSMPDFSDEEPLMDEAIAWLKVLNSDILKYALKRCDALLRLQSMPNFREHLLWYNCAVHKDYSVYNMI